MAKKKDQPKPKTREEAEALKAKKRKSRRNTALIVLVILIGLIWYGMQPIIATTEYGICKTFVETRVRYPTSLQLTFYDIYGNSTRLFYTYRDASGSMRSEVAECIINPHPQIGYIAETIKINRIPISETDLVLFNKSIPAILSSEMNLQVPKEPEVGNLYELRPQEPTFLQ